MRADTRAEDSVTEYTMEVKAGMILSFNFSRSTFTLHLRRKYLYYLIHLIVPYSLFSWIAIFTFILQPSRPERLNIGMILSLLSLTECCIWPNNYNLLMGVDLTIINSLVNTKQ